MASLYENWADEASSAYGIPSQIFRSLVNVESGWNIGAVGSSGEYGLTQLMPGTADDMGVNRYDVRSNLQGGAKYLSQQYAKFGNWRDALAAYNAGPNSGLTGGYGYADKVLADAGVSSGNQVPSSVKSFADGIHEWLYGKGTAQLTLNDKGSIVSEKDGVQSPIVSPSQIAASDWFKGSIWSGLAVVAIVALVGLGVWSMFKSSKG